MRTRIAMAAMAFVICAAAVGPALADRNKHHRGRKGYERHDRGWYGPRQFFYSPAPDVYYVPPPVVYTPAYPAPPRVTFIFPFWH
jgi:hypothetical protein